MPEMQSKVPEHAHRESAAAIVATMRGLRSAARACVEEREPGHKVDLTFAVLHAWRHGVISLEDGAANPTLEGGIVPGVPEGLALVPPTKVKRRGFGSTQRLSAFVHSIAHIEWNAINLAW